MSNAIFPTLPGLAWNVGKTPVWSTRIQKTVSGRELRAAFYNLPEWHFKLTYEFLRAGAQQELQTLLGFFNARQGSFDSFLYRDPNDNSVTAQQFGIGNGAQTRYQLTRAFGGYAEPVTAPMVGAAIFVNGASAAATVDTNTGIVTFTAPPANGAVLTWTGSFYFRCRFLYDSIDFEEFLRDLWQAKKVEFTSIKP